MTDGALTDLDKDAEIAILKAKIAELQEDQWPEQLHKTRGKSRKET